MLDKFQMFSMSLIDLKCFFFTHDVSLVSLLQVMMALSAHLGSLEAEKQKLRAQVSFFCPSGSFQLSMTGSTSPLCFCPPPPHLLASCFCPFLTNIMYFSLHFSFPHFLILAQPFCISNTSSCVSVSSGASSVSGEPVAAGRAGQSPAAAAGQRAGGGHVGGAQQAPAVHVLHTQIRPGGAAAGEND